MRDKKKPGISKKPPDKRQVRTAPRGVITDNPLWAFRHFDADGPWCWSNFIADDILDVVGRLKELETMTWAQIEQSGSHFIETTKICKQAQDKLVKLKRDDVDSLFSLRISGKGRIWGVRVDHVLQLLWWDPKHEICESKLKHI